VALFVDAKLSEDMNAARLRSQAARKQQRTSPPASTNAGGAVPPPLGSDPCFLDFEIHAWNANRAS
jgi:hypothetical protein